MFVERPLNGSIAHRGAHARHHAGSAPHRPGDGRWPIVKQINAAIDNWPLVISQYRNSATLRAAVKWNPKLPPADGSPPFVFVGLNVLVAFGPTVGNPLPPDAIRQAQATRLVEVIDPLLWPLEQRSVTPVPVRTAVAASPAPAPPKPSSKPISKPSPKPSPKS